MVSMFHFQTIYTDVVEHTLDLKSSAQLKLEGSNPLYLYFYNLRVVQTVFRTLPFHGSNTSSNLITGDL